MTPELAQAICKLKPSADSSKRVVELATKADAGVMSAEEREEYKAYVDAGDMLALLKAKARRFLAEHNS